jgi:hypothetical protein
MSGEGTEFPPGLDIPEAQRLIVAAGEQRRPSGEKATLDHSALMPGKDAQFLPGLGLPEAQRLVAAAGEQASAVGRKGDAPHPTLMCR